MKKLYLVLIILIFSLSCEKEDETVVLSNKVEFSELLISDVSFKTAKVSSKIPKTNNLSIEEFGHCWGLDSLPEINDSISIFTEYSTNEFVSNLKVLKHNSTYYVRAYFKAGDVISYSDQLSFKTLEILLPTITTTAYSNLRAKTVISGGNVTNSDGSDVTVRGVCWNKTGDPTIEDNFTSDSAGIGVFQSNINGLDVNTKYYLSAYASNEVGTGYGEQISFTTKNGIPDFTTIAILQPTASSYTIGGEIYDDGGLDINEKGVCWNTAESPTISDYYAVNNSTNLIYSNTIENLEPATRYYYRSYIINNLGIHYGPVANFTTKDGIIEINTKAITNITSNSAVSGGDIVDDEGLDVLEKGVCWNTIGNPEVTNQKVIYTGNENNFNCNLESLNLSTTYYVRAYAINEVGVSYGNEVEFNTSDGSPIIRTIDLTDITFTSLKTGGEIISDEGSEITEKGICWNRSGSPDINDFKKSEGAGSENFISSITGLTEGETYYFRAYATNSLGVGYGNELSISLTADFVSIQDYDGNWYNVVKIGDQIWLKENLKTTHYSNGEALVDGSDITATIDITDDYSTKYWFVNTYPDGDEAFKETYGLLYTWAAVMNGGSSSNSNPSGIQGACPDGWHVPSDSEWSDLAANYGGGILNVGGPLKEIGYEHWNEPNTGATNASGFTALPAGTRYGNSVGAVGDYAYFWTSTEYNNDSTMTRACINVFSSLWHQPERKSTGFSVRCVKDE